MLDERIKILARCAAVDGAFGRGSGGTQYEEVAEVWAAVTWSKGMKALREGAVDAYDTLMVRTRWHNLLTRDCRLQIKDKVYQIDSLNGSRREDQIQITCTELATVNP